MNGHKDMADGRNARNQSAGDRVRRVRVRRNGRDRSRWAPEASDEWRGVRHSRRKARNAEAATFPLACRNVYADLDRYAHCAHRDGVMVRIDPAYLARMRFHGGLTEIVVDGVGWLWARCEGLALPVFIHDNGPDPFASGLVRAWHAGKVAF